MFIDQKMMALFSLLFGVGVALFADRAAAAGRRVVLLSLWRFALLLVVGAAHSLVLDGDILVLYALCAPIVLSLRSLPPWLLAAAGVVVTLAGSALAPLVQREVNDGNATLGEFWFHPGGDISDEVLGGST